MMVRLWAVGAVLLAGAIGCRGAKAPAPPEKTTIRLATTTSTENSGLLGRLLPAFEARTGIHVDVLAMGTGQALQVARNGDCDVVLVHARKAEDEFVAAGFGVDRRDVMYNDFVIVGSAEDPARVAGMSSAAEAFRRVAAARAVFCSRGDASGTHQKEKELWSAAGVMPTGAWYQETGRGMGETLIVADQKRAYALTDRGTFIAFRKKTELKVLVEGDPALANPYGIIAVNPARHRHVKYEAARKLVDWLVSPAGQRMIADFTVDGERLFFPVAVAATSKVD
jgi:tungstate transport system substrate-binding protein